MKSSPWRRVAVAAPSILRYAAGLVLLAGVTTCRDEGITRASPDIQASHVAGHPDPVVLFVGDNSGDKIYRVNSTTGAATVFVAGFDCPEDMELLSDGSLIVAQNSACSPTNAKLILISPDGSTQTTVASILGVEGPALDAAGNLYAQSRGNHGIFRLPRTQISPPIFGTPAKVVFGQGEGTPEQDALAAEGMSRATRTTSSRTGSRKAEVVPVFWTGR